MSRRTPGGMIEWLKNDLQSTRADWIIAYFHHGSYTKGSHDNLAEFALGGDPMVRDQLIEAALTVDRDQNDQLVEWFTVQYDLREAAEASVQYAQDLIQFTPSGVETRRLSEPDANGIARWESRVRRFAQRTLFFRIVVSR